MTEAAVVTKKPGFVCDMDLDELPEDPTPVQTAAAAAGNANVQSWGADDEDEVSGSILKSSGPPYVKVSAGQPARIAFIPDSKVFGAPVHYDGINKKYYLCDSKAGAPSKCCKSMGDPKGRAAAFVFEYTNTDPKTGKMAAGVAPVVQVSIFTMSRSNWEDVRGAVEEGASVYDSDFRISVTEGQLTRKVAIISRVARWHEIEKQALELAAPFLADPKQLERALGRAFSSRNTASAPVEATLSDVKTL